MTKAFHVKTLLNYTPKDLNDSLIGEFYIIYDDGEMVLSNSRKTVLNRIFWEVHKQYPFPIISKHSVDSVLKENELPSMQMHMRMLEIVFWDMIDYYKITDPYERVNRQKIIFDITGNYYNFIRSELLEHMAAFDLMDYIQITEIPEIKELIDNPKSTREYVSHVYDVAKNIINTDSRLDYNNVIMAVRGNLITMSQLLQCAVLRGFGTEVTDTVLAEPILYNFTNGAKRIYDLAAESRTAAKALFNSEAPLQDSEYFGRTLQILCFVIENIVYQDCGSTDYLPYKIRGPVYNGDKLVFDGDLRFMIGKYYLDETTNQLKAITAKDTHLYNTVIKMRSPLKCKHSNIHKTCHICFGQLSDNIAPDTRLGQQIPATLSEPITQNTLKTKHVDANSSGDGIVLGDPLDRYFTIGKDGYSYYFNHKYFNRPDTKKQIVINKHEAYGISDVFVVDDPADLSEDKVSAILTIELVTNRKDHIERMPLEMEYKTQPVLFTTEFLRYLKIRRWSVDNRDHFVIDLDHWSNDKPIFRMVEKNISFAAHGKRIQAMIKSSMADICSRTLPDSPLKTLHELVMLVNSKLNVNIAVLEIIILALMIEDYKEGNYNLSRYKHNATLGVAEKIIDSRSVSTAMAFENQATVLRNPNSFFKDGKCDSMFDCFIKPQDVVKHKYPNILKKGQYD